MAVRLGKGRTRHKSGLGRITVQDKKQLLAQHPLLSKLSGQVVWMLFEEEGVDAACIDSFFDYFGRMLGDTVALMRRVQNPQDQGAAFVRLEPDPELVAFAGTIPMCSRCAALSGLVLPSDSPDLFRWLPPYSLGCRLRPVCISAEEAALAPRLPAGSPPPTIRLVCESNWLFDTDWSAWPKSRTD